jgi:ATP-dependent protease HslVU (ClpYQ) peptidase subunit
MTKVLICGTRGKFKDYRDLVRDVLGGLNQETLEIVEGCCKNSADEYAEEYAEENEIKIHHCPATEGTYIKRNVEMVDFCDEVIAFWNGYSYGTAQTIAQAVMKKKHVWIIELEREPVKHIELKTFM